MVKGIATSIISVAVLMGSVVACGGSESSKEPLGTTAQQEESKESSTPAYQEEMTQAVAACIEQSGGEVTKDPVLDEDGNWTGECEVPCWAAVVEGGGDPAEYCGTDVDPEAEAAAREWVIEAMAAAFSIEWLLSDIQSISAEEWVETCYLHAAERSLDWGEADFFQRWKQTMQEATDISFVATRLLEGTGEYGDNWLHACSAELLTPQEMERWAS